MKNIYYFLTLLFAFTTFISCSNDDEKIVDYSDLPIKSQLFLTTHFPDVNTSRIEKDNDSYDVYLVNGFEIDFNLDGEWDNIKGRTEVIPASILALQPINKMAEYVAENYTNSYINEIDKDFVKQIYEISLNNNTELIFDWDGVFVMIDPD